MCAKGRAHKSGFQRGLPCPSLGSPCAATRWPMARVGPSPSRRCRKTPITPQEACGHATAVLQGAVVCPPPPRLPGSVVLPQTQTRPAGDGGMTGGWSELSTLGCSPGRQGYGVGALAAPHSPFTERLKPPGAAACPPPPEGRSRPPMRTLFLQLWDPSASLSGSLGLLSDYSLAWLSHVALLPGEGWPGCLAPLCWPRSPTTIFLASQAT